LKDFEHFIAILDIFTLKNIAIDIPAVIQDELK